MIRVPKMIILGPRFILTYPNIFKFFIFYLFLHLKNILFNTALRTYHSTNIKMHLYHIIYTDISTLHYSPFPLAIYFSSSIFF